MVLELSLIFKATNLKVEAFMFGFLKKEAGGRQSY